MNWQIRGRGKCVVVMTWIHQRIGVMGLTVKGHVIRVLFVCACVFPIGACTVICLYASSSRSMLLLMSVVYAYECAYGHSDWWSCYRGEMCMCMHVYMCVREGIATKCHIYVYIAGFILFLILLLRGMMDMSYINGDVIFRTWLNMMVIIPNKKITPITPISSHPPYHPRKMINKQQKQNKYEQ